MVHIKSQLKSGLAKIREQFGIKSREEKDAESIFELTMCMEQTKQYLSHTKVLLDDLSTKIDSAVAANDTTALEHLRTKYKLQETTYNEMCSFVSEIESAIARYRAEGLASGLSDIIKKYDTMRMYYPADEKNKIVQLQQKKC
ncbi:MAG: hypothetical protein HY438_02370 [DPANN group archaeon]|nr:hypothetical protein [DPANN group archaeon]